MHSIRFRLNFLLIVTVTLALMISGAYNYYTGERRLTEGIQEQENAMRARLATVLPGLIWNFDESQVISALEAEMRWPDLAYLSVFDPPQLAIARGRQNNKVVVASSKPPPGASSMDITYEGRHVGTLYYQTSSERIDERLRGVIHRRLVEILLVDAIIIAVLALGFSVVALRPLARLQRVLDRMAQQHDFSLLELQDLGKRRDELAHIGNSVVRIAMRLMDELEDRKLAEVTIRDAKRDVEDAYRQLKATQASLVQSEKMASLGSLVAGVAHEVNTPVGVILTSASVLSEETAAFRERVQAGQVKKSDLQGYCDTAGESAALILNNAQRAASLIQSFKQVAVDQTSEARRTFELRQYLSEILTSLTPALHRRPIEIKLDCPRAIELDGFPGALSQIVTNLLTNALTHAFDDDEAGVIGLSATGEGNTVTLTFSDNGRGIPQQHLARVFDPFFTTRRGQGGSGLGLHLVYNLVTQTLGGEIVVQSEIGQGTTFYILLPRVAPQRGSPP
ncbi:sensor histidine kinase [Chitiniphilus eburneus]|uniref:histidine kinase n=1 Tax=Chitiniphilus eburneus TaxID=2571148 RepID=A0A4V5MNU3_9NEIS|nr:ATP-binding protein [Chitiniphilus eburneus]TJZ66138.1 histidine kinase [Chitiniphilus eburneus]